MSDEHDVREILDLPAGADPKPPAQRDARPTGDAKEPWFMRLAVELLSAGLVGVLLGHLAFFGSAAFTAPALADGAYLLLPIMVTGALTGGIAGLMPALTSGSWRTARNIGLPFSLVVAAAADYAGLAGLAGIAGG